MNIETVVLQDEDQKLYKLKKVKDSVYDSAKKQKVSNWLWIYAETAEFFNFEVWNELDNAYLYKIIHYKNKLFKVIAINSNPKIRYS
ncbi:hypothetical protein [Acinetobacter sp. Ac_5812]|uniref:hypothetical protein n=1 Tax=Acinetobacter sp. Ac_5812 TaxID=1848937 RepID=UPI0014900F6C|nr:hypothetical protein [Acinetobacter sp. Ac_5812]NNP69824.1 hypothetical protein [Acinetobacter sp. Ac_5812]